MRIKFRVSLTEIVVLMLIASILVSVGGALGYRTWHDNMAIALNENAEFIFSGINLTSEIQYQTVANSFLLGFVFTFLGAATGFLAATTFNCLYLVVKIVVSLIRKHKASKFDAVNKNNKK